MTRVVITLEDEEREALAALALRELRTPKDQALAIIRDELYRCGLLEANDPKFTQSKEQVLDCEDRVNDEDRQSDC